MTRRVALILNPGSGGGRHQPALRAAAARRGWSICDLGRGVDPAGLARGLDADVLVAAGGDGTVSAVAGVAVERGLPLAVLPCGTRNHFAADAGLDVADPSAGIAAADGVEEVRVDLGSINGRVFLNNVSIGFYSSMISDPQYRSHRLGVTTGYLRRALLGEHEPLTVTLTADPRVALPAQVLTLLISNNAYSPGLAPGAALRPRLDEGMLWTHVLGVHDGTGPTLYRLLRTAAGLLTGRAQVAAWPSAALTLRMDRNRVRVGIDGEAVSLDTPLELTVRPGALRLLTAAPRAAQERTIQVST